MASFEAAGNLLRRSARQARMVRELRNLTIGVPEELLDSEGAVVALRGSNYVDAYVRLQRARAGHLLSPHSQNTSDPETTRKQVMATLSVPVDMRDEAVSLSTTDPRLLEVLTECWRTDADQALRRLWIVGWLPILLLLPVSWVVWLEISPEITTSFWQALTDQIVMAPVFGFLGAAASLLIDTSKSPRAVHWAVVWGALNRLRLAGGVVVGFALCFFSPLLFGAPDTAGQPPTPENLRTMYLLATAFGFSQDVFFSKLAGVATGSRFGQGQQ